MYYCSEHRSTVFTKFLPFARQYVKFLAFLWLNKESACHAGDEGDMGLIPGLGRSPEGGHGNTLQYSCLENLIEEPGGL